MNESTDPSTLFLNFLLGAKIRQHGREKRLKISNVAKFWNWFVEN